MGEIEIVVLMIGGFVITTLGIVLIHQLLYKYNRGYKIIWDGLDEELPNDISLPLFYMVALVMYLIGVGIALWKSIWRKE